MPEAVDEKGWSAIDATAYSTHEILANPIRVSMLGESALHLIGLITDELDVEHRRTRLAR